MPKLSLPLRLALLVAGTTLPLIMFAAGIVLALAWSAVAQFLLPLRGTREFGLDRGGISSLLMLNPILISLGALIAGPLAQVAGVRAASLMLAGATALAVVVLYFVSPTLRQIRVK